MSNGSTPVSGEKICITSEGNSLNSNVDPRFGRCKYFIFVEMDSRDFESVLNPNIESMGGAGIQSGQFIADKGVKTVLTGNVGPNAFQTLQAAGVSVITGVSGIVEDAVQQYAAGALKPISSPSVGSKFGMP